MIHQLPTGPNTWLYKEDADGTRLWWREAYHPDGAPLWQEATEAEYEQWQAEHPEPEPQPEEEDADGTGKPTALQAYTAPPEAENEADGAGRAGGHERETVEENGDPAE